MAWAFRALTCITSINFVERIIDIWTTLFLCVERWCHQAETQSSIPVCDAGLPYSFGQVSQERNSRYVEMND